MSCHAVAILSVFGTALVASAREPTGSDYLRSLPPTAAPFGRLVKDSFPFDGVRIQRWRRDQPEVDWLTVWIDLEAPGLGYRITPIRSQPGPHGNRLQTVSGQTTVDFLREASALPRVDLAVNTVAFWPFPAGNGTPVFLSEPVWQKDDNQRNPEPPSPLLGLFQGKAQIADAAALRQARPLLAFGSFLGDDTEQAVTDGRAVHDGAAVSTGDIPHARTLAGVAAAGRVLILVVADGYNPGASIGLTRRDAGRLLQAAGAHQAIFLDGGGSSTLVARAEDGLPVVLNRPAGLQKTPGTLRYVAVNLGFTNLRRLHDPFPALADWKASTTVACWQEIVTWARVNQREALALFVGLALAIGSLAALWSWRRRRRLAQGEA